MNTTRKRGGLGRILALTASLTMIAAGAAGVALASPASATPSPKVTICHATASTTNPYTTNTVDQSSVDEENNKYLNGHGDHTGPVFDPAGGKNQPVWGDIIPPFTNTTVPDGSVFPGYNWNAAGQAIYNNGCKPIEFSYSKQVTITKTICYNDQTDAGATATGENKTVTSWTPITDAQKAAVDAEAQASAEAAFAAKYPGYKEGECTAYYYEKQITITKTICLNGQTINDASATGTKFYINSNDPITDEQKATIDAQAQASAEAAFNAQYAGYADGACEVTKTYSAPGGSNAYCVNDQNVTVAWAGAEGAASQSEANALAAANKANAYAAAGVDPNATAGDCSPVTTTEEPATVTAVAPATVTKPKPAKVVLPATVNSGVAGVPGSATLPASVPAGEGSDSLPMWAFALMALGLAGALGAGSRMLGARK